MIPTYRAKKIDSNEWVEGYYIDGTYKFFNSIIKECFIVSSYTPDNNECWGGSMLKHEIDPKTLAIHFQNMIDKNDKKIFASLNENGLGGDIVYIAGKGECITTFDSDGAYASIMNNVNNIFDDLFSLGECFAEDDVEQVIGIHKG